MKKYFALFTLLAFIVAFAGMVYADSRTPAEKIAAGRAYLKLLDQKIIKHRDLGNTAVVADLQAQKKSTLAKMAQWKAEMEGSPAPMAPVPPPPMGVKPAPATAGAGLFGWGLVTAGDIGYIGGSGKTASILADGAIVFADPLSMGSMMGLSADAINYKLGLGLVYGKEYANATMRALIVSADGILNLPAEWMGGVKSYVGAQVDYPVYKSSPTGKVGGLLYVGIKGDLELGLGGDTFVEVGYGSIRRTGQSTKGIELKVGQEILL